MSKKRTSYANALQADFWTALPIDECRARIIQLQRINSTSFAMLRYDQQAPSTRDAVFSTFKLTRYHQHSFWQHHNLLVSNPYRLTIAGTLQATTDGTHVSLKLTIGTRSLLRLAPGLGWWNLLAGGLMGGVAGGLLLLQVLTTLINGTAVSQIQNNGGIATYCGAGACVSIWFFMLGAITWARWSRYRNLAGTAQALIADIHAELHVVSYQAAPAAVTRSPLPY